MTLQDEQAKRERRYKMDFIISMGVAFVIGIMMAGIIFAFIGFLLIV